METLASPHRASPLAPRTLLGWLLAATAILPVGAFAQGMGYGETPEARPDPHRIINLSMGFLKEREPDLTAEESALYENARTQKPDLAIKLIEGIVAAKNERPASPAFLLLLGNLHYAAGSPAKAEASYLQAVDRFPTFLRAWTNLGVLHYAQKHYARAIPCFTKAVTLGSRDSTTFGMMAECLEQTGDPVGAEVAYIQALAGDPGNARWVEGLMHVYLAAQQYPRAEVMLRKLIHDQPGETRHWLTYAKLLHADGRRLEAIALLEQTAAIGVVGDDELLELAGLYADQQLVPEAIRSYEKVNFTAEKLGEARTLQLVRMRTARAEWSQAQALLAAIKRNPADAKSTEFLLAQAELLAAQKKWPAARDMLDEILRRDPLNGRALVGVGRAYAAESDVARATMAFETASQTRDGAREASVELATIELRNRHFEKSVSYLETALALEKNADLEEILGRVRALVSNQVEREM
jgi:tetratricopeptide (TPR) repeat protein